MSLALSPRGTISEAQPRVCEELRESPRCEDRCASVSDLGPPETTAISRIGAVPADINNQGNTISPAPLFSRLAAAPLTFQIVQPVRDVRQYLKGRFPQPHFKTEQGLFITLPKTVRDDIEALIGRKPGEGAFAFVEIFRQAASVQVACIKALQVLKYRWPLKTFREKYDRYAKTQDWTVLVNCSKAGAAWQETSVGLPDTFIALCAQYCAKFRRKDAKAEVVRAIKRWWKTGKDIYDQPIPMPGYEQDWENRNRKLIPDGWHYTNILRQIRERRAFTEIDRALTHEGIAAAKEFLPQVEGTASDIRFMEEVTFDDVRTDIIVIDPETGKPCELWLLVARCKGMRLVLGFVEHLSVARDDGTNSHLGQKEMKQLAAWLLERYHLPPYPVTWRVERGTATLTENSARALNELLGNRIRVAWTSMIGGKSPVGYREKAKGNSMGKASHESKNRSFHISASFLPGQTGAHYGIRPADLNARIKESVEIWEMWNRLPAHQRGQERYSLLTPREARKHFTRFALDQNFDTEHTYEGFEEVMEWYDEERGDWRPQNTFPVSAPNADRIRTRPRKESPVERAVRFIEPYREKWDRVSPDVIIAFLGHTHRSVEIQASGLIKVQIDNQKLIFHPPDSVPSVKSALAYFSSDDPGFLHVTDGRGSILGTWYRRDRVSGKDEAALQAAIRYTGNALKAAQARAAELCSDERAHLQSMRDHNADLIERGNAFNVTTSLAQSDGPPASPSLVAEVLTTVAAQTKAQIKAEQKREADLENRARAALRKSATMF